MSQKKFLTIVILSAGLIVGTIAYMNTKKVKEQEIAKNKSAKSCSSEKVVNVEVQAVKRGVVRKQVRIQGTIKGKNDVVIRSEINNGKIKSIQFVEGTIVKKDQELIIFEDNAFKANHAKAKAEYDMASAAAKTAKRLMDNNAGTRKEYDDAVAKMNAAKANIDVTEYELSKTVVRAPFTGLIGIMKEQVGNVVQNNAPLVSIVDTRDVVVNFKVPALYVQHLSVGQFVDVEVEAYKDTVFCGAVEAIDSVVDEKVNSIGLKALIPNEDGKLHHGMLSTVTLTVGEKENAVKIAEDAVVRHGDREYVYVVDKKTKIATLVPVTTGIIERDGVEILNGVKPGDLVVTSGQQNLGSQNVVNISNIAEISEDGNTKTNKKRSKQTKNKSNAKTMNIKNNSQKDTDYNGNATDDFDVEE